MPATSKAQQRAAGAALAARRGEIDPSALHEAAREMFDSMDEDELEALAATRHDGLPEHVDGGRRGTTPARGDRGPLSAAARTRPRSRP